jgi:predicted molibdopterin-dependent oxidoreductase YjgC
MAEQAGSIAIVVDGRVVQVEPGTTVAAAVLIAGRQTRRSVAGEARTPLCGMGLCFECTVKINGVPHQQSCQVLCAPGIEVTTGGVPATR